MGGGSKLGDWEWYVKNVIIIDWTCSTSVYELSDTMRRWEDKIREV